MHSIIMELMTPANAPLIIQLIIVLRLTFYKKKPRLAQSEKHTNNAARELLAVEKIRGGLDARGGIQHIPAFN